MAEKEKKAKTKVPRKKLKAITHHKADGGGFIHEHHMEDEAGNKSSSFAGFSPDLADVHQHIDDHLGPDAEAAEQGPEEAGAPGGGGAPPDGGGGGPMAA